MEDLAEKFVNMSRSSRLARKNEAAGAEAETVNNPDTGGSLHRDKFFEEEVRHEIIGKIAKEIRRRRMADTDSRAVKEYEGLELYGDEIDGMLRREGVRRKTKEADEFMEKWDWDQAAKIYERKFGKKTKDVAEEIQSAVTVPEKRVAEKEGAEVPVKKGEVVKGVKEYEFGEPGTDTTPERAIAWHTFKKIDESSDLDYSLSKEESNVQLIDLTKKLVNDFTTHGLWDCDPKTGKIIFKLQSDLDGRACILLLQKAGFDTSKVKYVRQGDSAESGWVLDTSGIDGFEVQKGGDLMVTDHHADHSKKDSSATKFLYDALVKYGALEFKDKDEKAAYDEFVKFVTKEDNKDYADGEIKQIVDDYPKNLVGIRRFLRDDQLLKVFREKTTGGKKFNPYEAMTGEYLKTLSFQDPKTGALMKYDEINRRLLRSKHTSLRKVEEMKAKGFVVDTDRYGPILIDTGRIDGKARRRKVGLGDMWFGHRKTIFFKFKPLKKTSTSNWRRARIIGEGTGSRTTTKNCK